MVWLKHIRRTLKTVFSIRADVTQELITASADSPVSVATGLLELRRGGRFRMTVEKPSKTILVSNAKEIWYYDKASRVAYQIPKTDTPWTLFIEALLGNGGWDAFSVAHIGGSADPATASGFSVLQFTPVDENRYVKSIVLTVHSETPCVQRILVITKREDVIRLTIRNAKINVGIGTRRFNFTPPKRARIVPQ
jgi:chaperone LolA